MVNEKEKRQSIRECRLESRTVVQEGKCVDEARKRFRIYEIYEDVITGKAKVLPVGIA